MSTQLDFAAEVAFKQAYNGSLSGTTVVTSSAIDTATFGGLAVATSTGTTNINVNGSNAVEVSFLEGPTTDVADAVAIPARRIIHNPDVVASDTVVWASVKADARYVFVRYTPKASVTAEVHTLAALGHARDVPTY